MSAAAKLVGEARLKPRRTVRVVLFANEEFGLSGAGPARRSIPGKRRRGRRRALGVPVCDLDTDASEYSRGTAAALASHPHGRSSGRT
jgi:hypothetical protein